MLASCKESYDTTRQYIKKLRHHFADKGPYSQRYGFSSSHTSSRCESCPRLGDHSVWVYLGYLSCSIDCISVFVPYILWATRGTFPGFPGQKARFFLGFFILIWPRLPPFSFLSGIILSAGKKRKQNETGKFITASGLLGLFIFWSERLGCSQT